MVSRRHRTGKSPSRRRRRATAPAAAREVASPEPEEIFQEDGSRGFVPWADNFGPGVSLRDAQRAMAARLGFMEELLRDPRVVDRFCLWLDALKAAPPELEFDVAALLEELGIAEGWCLMQVLEAFQRMIVRKSPEAATDLPPTELLVHAPSVVLFLRTEPGESTTELRERLEALHSAAIAQIDEAEDAVRGGAAPKGEGEHLRRWGRWYYAARIAQPPRNITDLARENHADAKHVRPFEACDCRRQINKGIAEAESLIVGKTDRAKL